MAFSRPLVVFTVRIILWLSWGGIFKLWRSPGIDSKESIRRAGMTTLFLLGSMPPYIVLKLHHWSLVLSSSSHPVFLSSKFMYFFVHTQQVLQTKTVWRQLFKEASPQWIQWISVKLKVCQIQGGDILQYFEKYYVLNCLELYLLYKMIHYTSERTSCLGQLYNVHCTVLVLLHSTVCVPAHRTEIFNLFKKIFRLKEQMWIIPKTTFIAYFKS